MPQKQHRLTACGFVDLGQVRALETDHPTIPVVYLDLRPTSRAARYEVRLDSRAPRVRHRRHRKREK